MPLVRQASLAGVVLVALSCSDATAPTRVSPSYYLVSIDGRSLPDTNRVIPGVETITTVWGSLTLSEGIATVQTHERRIDVGVDSLEYTDSTAYPYSIRGDSIEIKSTGSCGELCEQSWHGTASEASVTLVSEEIPGAPLYRYEVTHEAPNSTQH